MRVVILTADSAQRDSNGKVHALGMNWTWIGTPSPPIALVLFIDPDPGELLPDELRLAVELFDGDGRPAIIDGNPEPLQAQIVAKPEDLDKRFAVAFGVGPGLPLKPGQYSWRVIDGAGDEYARVEFEVRLPVAH